MADSFEVTWQELHARAPYPPEAFEFIRQGLAHTVEMIHGEGAEQLERSDEGSRHVTGQQLCLGLRHYAIHRYGRLAKTVFQKWGVRQTEDFGRIVFAMVDAGLMRKSDEDSIEDFRGVYDFDEAFSPGDDN